MLLTRIAILFAGLGVPVVVHSAQWAEVTGGAGAVSVETIKKLEVNLERVVQSARKGTKPSWSRHLIQYRVTTVGGRSVVEVHGSCDFDEASFDVRSAYFDEHVLDGGECYFEVTYDVTAEKYSTVRFHGVA